jgi:hypothetical protein
MMALIKSIECVGIPVPGYSAEGSTRFGEESSKNQKIQKLKPKKGMVEL